jgi:hypothetical protein
METAAVAETLTVGRPVCFARLTILGERSNRLGPARATILTKAGIAGLMMPWSGIR